MEINDIERLILLALKDQAHHPPLSQVGALITELREEPPPSPLSGSDLFPHVASLIDKDLVEGNLIVATKHKTFAGLHLTREGHEVAEALE